MNFYVLTLFPDMITSGLNTSIIGRAISEELIGIRAVNIRDYTLNKHGRTDDYPYGGGAGMVMQALGSIALGFAMASAQANTANAASNASTSSTASLLQ